MNMFPYAVGVLVLFAIVFVLLSIKFVPQQHVYIVERLGKYHRSLNAGINFIIPIIDTVAYRISLKTRIIDSPKQDVITKDNVNIQVDSFVYYEVIDPFKAAYKIENFAHAISALTISYVRQVIGELELDETLASRETINSRLRESLDSATHEWGIRVSRVELKDITPPETIQEAMNQQMKAERQKRAEILEAEGRKQAAILIAQGEKEAQVLRAQAEKEAAILEAEGVAQSLYLQGKGQADQIRLVAEAEAQRIKALVEAGITPAFLVYKSYEALQKMAEGEANKIFLPVEATSSLAGLGAIGELLKKDPNNAS